MQLDKNLCVALAGEPIETTPFLVVASSEPDAPGTVSLTFYGGRMPVYLEDDIVTVVLPESAAMGLGSTCTLATTRLAHLRDLHRRGELAPDAYRSGSASVAPTGTQVGRGALVSSQVPVIWKTSRGTILLGGKREAIPPIELTVDEAMALADAIKAVATGHKSEPA